MACVAALMSPMGAEARPVSYPGGWTLIAEADGGEVAVLAHYSPTSRYSIGGRFGYDRDDDIRFAGAQATTLLRRWNRPASQANLYATLGGGMSWEGSRSGATALFGLMGDAETRRLFIGYSLRAALRSRSEDELRQTLQLGIAPYVADYGALHTWLLVQVDRREHGTDRWSAGPVVRLFKGSSRAEIGIDDDGDALLSFIQRF